jgi:hypothetical protein
MSRLSSTIYLGIFIFVTAFFIIGQFITLGLQSVQAEKTSEFVIKNGNVDENNKLVVVSKINIQNISKTGIIKVVGEINGENFVKNISLDKVRDSAKKIQVRFEMNKNNELNNAHKPDEFFVCAYHFTNASNNNNNNNKVEPTVNYFDCNEGDIQSTTSTTKASLFKPKSQVYNKTAYYSDIHSNPEVIAFATLPNVNNNNNDTASSSIIAEKSLSNNNTKQENDSNKPVKVKILVPMEDKKNAKKIKIMAMLKGQFKSEIVDVQEEFKKIKGTTITRTFAFDRNTDMGPIQIGDRFHTCVIGKELYPPEGSECEKRLIKDLDKPNPLAAR